MDDGEVSLRVINKAYLELQDGENTLSIILSAMAIECQLASVFMKWKHVDLIPSGVVQPTDEMRSVWEEEFRRKGRINDRLDMICKFLTGKTFDDFIRDNAFQKLIEDAHPAFKTYRSPKKFFEEQLFRKRNRVVHLGHIDFDGTEAGACYSLALTLWEIVGRMEAVRLKRLEEPHSQS